MSDAVATRSTLTLSDAELFELTRYRQPSQQLAELHRRGFYRAALSNNLPAVKLKALSPSAVLGGFTHRPRTGR